MAKRRVVKPTTKQIATDLVVKAKEEVLIQEKNRLQKQATWQLSERVCYKQHPYSDESCLCRAVFFATVSNQSAKKRCANTETQMQQVL